MTIAFQQFLVDCSGLTRFKSLYVLFVALALNIHPNLETGKVYKPKICSQLEIFTFSVNKV